MMRYLLDQARAHGLTEIRLEVIEANTGAYALYRELGFENERYLLILERAPGPIPDLALTAPVEECPPLQLLAHYASFHDVPNCWQRGLRSLEALTDHLQGWAVLQRGEIAAWAAGWANDHAIRLLDLAAAPDTDRQAYAALLLAHLHRENPAAHGSSYNVAENDPVLPAYWTLGYTTSLRQIEMRLALQQP
jgi:GNAT superfamily N-acetyltransferase